MVHRQQLVKVDFIVQQRQRHGPAARRLFGQLAKKCADRHRHVLFAFAAVQRQNAVVLGLQIDQAVPPNGDQVGHVVHTAQLGVLAGDAVLDALLVALEIVQQRTIVAVQEKADALRGARVVFIIQAKLPAKHNVPGRQAAAAHIQPQRPVSQHVQPLPGV